MSNDFPEVYFKRHDESSDHNFYAYPRKVVHIDEGAIGALRDYYAEVLPQTAVILDMMSSWRSHLPENLVTERVIGLGMNAEEMADNPQLDAHVVHSLNDNPRMPYEENTFDAVLCAVSVQYLTEPVKVFTDIQRVLKPGGICVMSFSNRCFPTKAVAVWLSMTDKQHIALVSRYFELAGGFTGIHAEARTGAHNPMYIVSARKAAEG